MLVNSIKNKLPVMRTSVIFFFVMCACLQLDAQILNNPRVGGNILYGGQSTGLLGELNFRLGVGDKFDLITRYTTNANTADRVTFGVLYKPIQLGRFYPSIGLDLSYNYEELFGFEEREKFLSIEVPLMLNYRITKRIEVNTGLVFRESKFSRANNNYLSLGFNVAIGK